MMPMEMLWAGLTNLVLDTRMNQVEFAGGDITELTPNVIAESMYSQCDLDWN